MYKRSLSLVVVILLALCIPLAAAAAGYHVHDDASLMSDDEVAQLETLASRLSDDLDCDIVILTVDSIGSKSVVAFADDYYDDNGYAEDGILLMLSMHPLHHPYFSCFESPTSSSSSFDSSKIKCSNFKDSCD